MKRIIVLFVIVFISFSMWGCKKEVIEETSQETEEETSSEIQTQEETTVSQWPENEFTGIVPKPEFGQLNGAVEIDGEFFVTINASEISRVKEYVELVKTFGFTENIELIDEEAMGIDVYSFSAENTNGYKILVEYAVKVCSVTITKST